jgi:predicted  nucleic acid-binding Zn-ribbon protein
MSASAICYTDVMNDDQFDDLKQFIDSRISQTEAMFEQRLSATEAQLEQKIEGLSSEVHRLRDEMHDGFAGVGEAVEELHKADDELNQRLTKLEHQTAA